MKTRILVTVLMLSFTTMVMAETNQTKSEDSLSTSQLAVISGSNISETTEYNASLEMVPSGITMLNTVTLEEWVESREVWENEANESAEISSTEIINLEGWYETRETWEQENSEVLSVNTVLASVNMEEWIGTRETWEQDPSASDLNSIVYTEALLENWIATCDVWEQEVSASDLSSKFEGTLQPDWMTRMEAWEQK